MLIILQNHRLSFSQICMSSSSFSYPPREPPFIQQSSSSSIFSRTIFYPTINLMFSDLSQFLLLHIIRAGIIYIYFQSIPHFQPYNTYNDLVICKDSTDYLHHRHGVCTCYFDDVIFYGEVIIQNCTKTITNY